MRVALTVCAAGLAACAQLGPDPGESVSVTQASDALDSMGQVRLTGVLEPRRSARVVVPQLTGPANRLTLTALAPHGATVARGDVVAEFDAIEQIGLAREASARFEDLSEQVRQKAAENRAVSERRRAEMQEAEADLARALLEVSKAEILSDADQQQNALRAERARLQVQSLQISHTHRDQADAAALRILELQRDRQRAAFEQARANIERLQLRAPLSGILTHATTFRSSSMTRVQEGDQLFRNAALLSIFDPSEMLVKSEVGEPDGALLLPGLEATVHIDAYPDLALRARFESASPVASSVLGSPIKTFTAIFRLEESDPRLMPDLSAAVVLDAPDERAVAFGDAP